ncbi:MAG: HAMP domain-containing protein [Actinomycetota bacterium]|nr:HAMP domain-containing protein [Actinomycetota bacterium]
MTCSCARSTRSFASSSPSVSLRLLLASLGAWVAAGRILAPVRLVTDTARSISETDLSKRIPVNGDDEVSRLSATFNDMLERLQKRSPPSDTSSSTPATSCGRPSPSCEATSSCSVTTRTSATRPWRS